MEKTILESGKKLLSEHYAAALTADGTPTKPSDIAGLVQCHINQPDYAKLQLETEALQIFSKGAHAEFFKLTGKLERDRRSYNWGDLEDHLYILTQERPRPFGKK